jgi:hypothetical protein
MGARGGRARLRATDWVHVRLGRPENEARLVRAEGWRRRQSGTHQRAEVPGRGQLGLDPLTHDSVGRIRESAPELRERASFELPSTFARDAHAARQLSWFVAAQEQSARA